MALNIKRGKLARPASFKLTGKDDTKLVRQGAQCWYTRSPVQPGMFVIWADAGLRWYIRIDAIELPNYVEE